MGDTWRGVERSTGTGETDQGVTTAILSDKERKSVCHALTLESLFMPLFGLVKL
jgi:hypothetical protein